jgi:hypothetical protein
MFVRVLCTLLALSPEDHPPSYHMFATLEGEDVQSSRWPAIPICRFVCRYEMLQVCSFLPRDLHCQYWAFTVEDNLFITSSTSKLLGPYAACSVWHVMWSS